MLSHRRFVAPRARYVCAVIVAVLVCGCGETGGEQAAIPGADKLPAQLILEVGAGLARDAIVLLDEDELAADGGLTQGVGLDLERMPADEAQPFADERVEARAALYELLQQRVVAALEGRDDVSVRFRYENIPFLLVNVRSLEALELIAAQPEVKQVYREQLFSHQLAQTLPLIRQPEVRASGKLGSSTSVAVLDTGVDYTRSAFGSCVSAGAAGCKVAYANDFAPSDDERDDNGHGTNVAAIVLGVAPGAKVLALDVFAGSTAPGSAILKAIDWTIANRITYNTVAMNLSLGSGASSALCSKDFFAPALAIARQAGILAAVASGNNGYRSSLSSPACVPAAISVGAVYDRNVGGINFSSCSDASSGVDKIACFSNSASFLSMLAPGAFVTAGGYTMAGTSQAAPHVAGAIAVLRAASPSEPLGDTVAKLTGSGPELNDPRNGVTKRRLDLAAVFASRGVDTTPPTGAVVINAAAQATSAASVTLAIQASDDVAVQSMCISNTDSCSTFVTFVAMKPWTLASGDGVKTVRVTLRDAAGNQTKVSDTIVRDSTPPSNPSLQANPGDARVELSWSAGTDAGSGVTGYKVVHAVGTSPASCNVSTVLYSGSALSTTHSGALNGTLYGYRVCSLDAAGNLGPGSTASALPLPERDAPVGTVQIDAGATYAKSTSVTLTLDARDASGVASLCISNSSSKTGCTSFGPYLSSRAWTLGDNATVHVWFRDKWGNTSATSASDSIVIDKVAPVASPLLSAASPGQVALSWNAASDAISGVASYTLRWAAGVTAPNCSTGSAIYTGTGTAVAHTGLSAGKHSYRLCVLDRAGNLSSGVIRTVNVP